MRFHLRCSTRFLASPEEVWALLCSPEALQAPLPGVTRGLTDVEGLRSGLAGEGLPLLLEGQVRLAGLPLLAWPLELLSCTPGERVVVRSDNRLFEGWEHQRVVEQASDATRYLDALSFTPRWGPPRKVAGLLRTAFIRKHRAAAEQLSSDARATAVAMLRVAVDVESDGTDGFM